MRFVPFLCFMLGYVYAKMDLPWALIPFGIYILIDSVHHSEARP